MCTEGAGRGIDNLPAFKSRISSLQLVACPDNHALPGGGIYGSSPTSVLARKHQLPVGGSQGSIGTQYLTVLHPTLTDEKQGGEKENAKLQTQISHIRRENSELKAMIKADRVLQAAEMAELKAMVARLLDHALGLG